MMRWIKQLEAPSWECVHFPEENPLRLGIREPLEGSGVRVFGASLEEATSERQLLESVARAMHFPAYFGLNWDAFDECLRDLSWLEPFNGIVLTLDAGSTLWRRCPTAAARLIESWLFCAQEWSEEKKGLHLIFVLEARARG